MKLQSLAVIFVIIVLPISLILSSYTSSRIDTLTLQISYDTKLYDATYDAIKAFQLNTANSSTSNIVDSKMRDIEAAANTFFTAIENNFSMNGYNKEALQNHIPALVFTLYDGYYIYSPYRNRLDEQTADKVKNSSSLKDGEMVYELKPYVYYSCRYKNSNCDVVITYSLDSYITIKGMVTGNYVDVNGYLLSNVSEDGRRYKDININTETLTETVIVDGLLKNGNKEPYYRKINGVKYYQDRDDGTKYVINNSQKQVQPNLGLDIQNNDNAIQYYKEAAALKKVIMESDLRNLRTSDAVDENGNYYKDSSDENERNMYGDYKIFEELDNLVTQTQIEDDTSNFNNHKLDVIKHSIERNLSIAISNFDNVSTSTMSFQMPILKDYEWDKISHNVSMITFLQGLSIGGKIYNGYSIVTNNKNEEYVPEESIYILTNDNVYHRARDEELLSKDLTNARGYFNMDFERKSGQVSGTTVYYYPRESVTGCYYSIVNQDKVQEGTMEDVLKDLKNKDPSKYNQLAQIYYTALARERYGMYRTDNSASQLTSVYTPEQKQDKKILIFGVQNARGDDLYELQSKLQEKYTTVDIITTTSDKVVADEIDNRVLPIASNYDLVICDAYAWKSGNIAKQSSLNYNLITIANDDNTENNNLIGEYYSVTDALIESIVSQTGVLSNIPMGIISEGEMDSNITKIRFKNQVDTLLTGTYFDDTNIYDIVGYTTIGQYKQIHSQTIFKYNYVQVLEALVGLALE